MLVCKVENLFGENGYCCGRMAEHVITVGKINYLPLIAVKTTKNTTLAVAFEDLFVDNSYDKTWDKMAVEKDGVKYLTLDTLRETSLVIMPCDLQEIEL